MRHSSIKNFQPGLFKNAPLDQNSQDSPGYCLTQLEIYNWGPFSGLHRIDFDPTGCALIGQTGSGKTTLVDAIMTLICALPKYNLASTGGHESDRDLISYVRGVTGVGGDDESIHIARSGQTITGLSTTYSAGNMSVTLTGLLWLDGSSNTQSDMKRLWIFDKNSHQGLADYLQQLQELGQRGLKLRLKEQPELSCSQNKKSYLAQCRRFFEVGENAFTLLNRAAGLKQLNSIDDLFRNLVLDDCSAFDRAQQVTEEFDELEGIHAELTIAKDQQQSLLPIAALDKSQKSMLKKLQGLEQQQQLLPRWYAHQGAKLWQLRCQSKQSEADQLQMQISTHENHCQQQQELVDNVYQSYQQLGGTSIEDLKRQIFERQSFLQSLKQNVVDYQQLCQALSLEVTVELEQLSRNQAKGRNLQISNQKNLDLLETTKEQKIQITWNEKDCYEDFEKEIQLVKAAPDSNIPPQFVQFQQALASELKLPTEAIPFVGQAVEVKDKLWQGAIERAIGSHRLRLIIDGEFFHRALDWINQRNNRLHVRLLNSNNYQLPAQLMADGFAQKINFKQGEHENVVKNFIASIDRHCVNSVTELKNSAFSMTKEGLMSGKKGLFEKQDQRPLGQGWMTGFDNKNRLHELEIAHQKSFNKWQLLQKELEEIKLKVKQLQQQQSLLQSLQKLDFSQLDWKSVSDALILLDKRLNDLQDPQSDTGKAQKKWQQSKLQLDELQQQLNDFKVKHQVSLHDLESSRKWQLEAEQRFSEALSKPQIQSMQAIYNEVTDKQIEQLANLERDEVRRLQKKIDNHQKQLVDVEKRLAQRMVFAKQKDTGALSEVGNELEDVGAFLTQLEILNNEALPNKLERFLHYLNQSSDQGVTQLLTRLDNEVSIIEERISELNETLQGVDFQPHRYLQLVPQKITHESLQSLQKALRDLRSAAMQDDQGESHYRALIVLIEQLKNAIERRRTRPALALLDPRYRLQFSVAIIDRESNNVIEMRTGSRGGSGGEKEIIASFILTASLSYAFCPKDRKIPLFATVILDEAFSKSSQAVSARIIFALRQFGLNPLFVTPNKEMRLLREHTASAVLVHRNANQSQVLSLSWRAIDQHLKQLATE